MKRYYLIPVLASVLAFAACTDSDIPADDTFAVGEKVFTAASESATKAYVESFKVLWDAADELAVFDDAGSQKEVFSLTSGAGTTAGTFKGKVSSVAENFYAAYPAASATSFSDGLIGVSVPDAQKLVEGGRNIDPAALVGVAASAGNAFAFKNVVSAIRFNIDMDNIVSVALAGNTEETVAGSVLVNPSDGTVAEVVEGAAKVELCPAGDCFEKGQYIITLLPGSFNHGLNLTFTDKAGNVTVRSNENALVVSRNSLLDLSAFINISQNELSFKPGETKEISVLSQGVESLKLHGAPEGWTVDDTALGSGVIKVTAPAAGATAPGAASFDLRGTTVSGDPIVSEDITVRLFGINNKAEFLEFRSLYQGDDETDNTRLNSPVTDPEIIGKYLVDGAVTLNTDLEFTSEDLLLHAYVIKYWIIPLEGNGHTLTFDFEGNAAVCALFQYAGADISNLKLTGSINYPYAGNGFVASLATLTTNTTLTVKNVSSSVDITATGSVQGLGGIIAFVNNGNVTLDGCSYGGKVTYTPASINAAPAFGGLVGRNGASLSIKNSINESVFLLELANKAMCPADNAGVGGILGAANADKSVSFENVENKGTITVNDINFTDNKDHYSQGVGVNLAGADVSGIAENGKLELNSFAGYTLAFTTTENKSFAYSASVQYEFAVGNFSGTISSVTVKEAPSGWNIDLSHAKDATPYITVTAPSQDAIKAGTAAGSGEIVIEATLPGGDTAFNVEKPAVRLFGINTKDEFLAFRAIYDPAGSGTGQNSPTLTGLDEWLVNGEITLNTDLTFTQEDLYRYYIVKFLDLPLEGNNRTITYDNISSAEAMLSFCQGLHADVRNLNFDGTLTATGKSAEVTMLAARGINSNSSSRKATAVSITNVHVKGTAVINYEGPAASAANIGFLQGRGTEANSVLTFTNCSVAGTINISGCAPQGIGGFCGADGNGVKTRVEFHSCTFSGAINLAQSINKAGSIRIGGFVGDGARQTYLEDCVCSAKISADMGGFVFNTTSKGSGIGGFIGRTTATPATGGHEMYFGLKNCTFSGSITATNMLASTAEFGWTSESYDSILTFGQLVGNSSPKPIETDNCTETGSISYTFAE